jgi:nitroreductase
MTTPFDTAATDELLSTTRSVRKRLDLDRPVEREVLLDCLRLAVQAPTGGNRQGWRWIVVTDPDQRAKLADLYRRGAAAYHERIKAAGIDLDKIAAEGQAKRVRTSSDYLIEIIDKVPALVIPCIEGRITDVQDAAGFYGSIHPAVWNFQLALRSRGLGSTFTTFHLAFEREAAAVLGVPDHVTQAAMIPVAYTKGTDFKPAERPPVEQITFWNAWGTTT